MSKIPIYIVFSHCYGSFRGVLGRNFSLEKTNDRKNTILVIFFIIPLLFFFLINFYRFSPNWGDSNKFFLYFSLMLTIFAGKLLGFWFRKKRLGRVVALAIITIAAILPFSVEAYERLVNNRGILFTGCERNVAQWIKLNTSKDAIFLTSDDLIHYVAPLSGRRVVDGAYTKQTGFRKPETDREVRKIFETGKAELFKKYHVTHVLVGPHEGRRYAVNTRSFRNYRLVYNQVCRGTRYRIYDVSQLKP